MNVKQFSCLGRNGSSIELVVNDMIVLDFQCIFKQNVDPELGLGLSQPLFFTETGK